MTETITLDGESLTIEQLVRIARDPSVPVECDVRTDGRVARSEALIAQVVENYRAAISQDVYTMKAGSQVFQPRFTSHGYQYIEITGIDRPLPLTAVEGVAISSVRELTADYKTSSEKVNRLW